MGSVAGRLDVVTSERNWCVPGVRRSMMEVVANVVDPGERKYCAFEE